MLILKKPLITYLEKYSVFICFGILFLSLLPMLLLQEDAYIRIHDYLNIEVIHKIILGRDGNYLKAPYDIIESYMGGIPRHCFPSSLNFLSWLFIFLKPIHACLINIFTVHLIAFAGMFLLLKKHIIGKQDALDHPLLLSGTALCFSLLPFLYSLGLSIAGQPLLFYAFLNISNNEATIKDYLIIFLFPFYSSFVLGGLFSCLTLGIFFFIQWWRTGSPNRTFLFTLVLFTLIFSIIEYQLLYGVFFDKNYISHRTEWNWLFFGKDFRWVLADFFNLFFHGFFNTSQENAHAAILQYGFVTSLVPIAFIVAVKKNKDINKLCILIGIIFFITLFATFFYAWTPLLQLRQHSFFLKTFQWDRFYFLLPILWYTTLALSLVLVSSIKEVGRALSIFFLSMQLFFVITNNHVLRHNFRNFCNKYLGTTTSTPVLYLSYKQYFSVNLFSQIAAYINKPQSSFKIVNILLHPSIAQYNGFHTLDGYIQSFPLAYKHQFRKVMEFELNKNDGNRINYDYNSNQCIILIDKVDTYDTNENHGKYPLVVQPNQNMYIKNLTLNTDQLKKMGCQYIFSGVEIKNYQENSLIFLNTFRDKNSPWEVFLYKII